MKRLTRLSALGIVPTIGVAVCLLVLNGLDRGYQGSLSSAAQQAGIVGIYMLPAYLAEFALFLPIHRYFVRRNIQHVRAYSVAGLFVGMLAGPVGLMLGLAVMFGVVAVPNAAALTMTIVAGACAGTVAGIVFRAISVKSSSPSGQTVTG